jgi:hypothetical protein
VFYLDRPGQDMDGFIIDADIELNNINYTYITVVDGQPNPAKRDGTDSVADFENTLTHELGHLQGLDHTCKDSATPANEVDENGNPPPPCNNLGSLLPADLVKTREATMFNSAPPGEIKKRSPEADDVNGICTIYPAANPQSECKHTDLAEYQTSGCSAVPGRAEAPLLVMIVASLLALRLARRRSPRL